MSGPDRSDDQGRIYLVHTPLDGPELAAVPGVVEHHLVAVDLVLIESSLSLSRLYHEIKWAAPPNSPLVVAELHTPPKVTRVEPGSTRWIRAHLGGVRDRAHDSPEPEVG